MPPIVDRPLPEPLQVLRELAADLRWSWNHCGDALWSRINPDIWSHTENPISVLQLTSGEQLQALAKDADFLRMLQQLIDTRAEYQAASTWYTQQYPASPLRGIAYFSMEFGLCESLPLYAGGLGVLAGDYLKTASDLGVPVVGIGLLYQQGYFRQTIGSDGWQHETYLFNDPGSLPVQPLRDKSGGWVQVETRFLSRLVRFRVWQAQVGRVTLYLLDSNDPCNHISDRGITSRLYGGGSELRLVQEIALGICGWRLVEQLGLELDICHLNEGHAAFATLERIRHYSEVHQVDFWSALWATRVGNIFTTHTPVAAGFDRYPARLLRLYINEFCQRMGVPMDQILRLGRVNPNDDQEPFNMAYLAMRTCGYSNGVSQLHGAISRRIFQPLYPRWPERDIPITHVTNGVHVPSWDSLWADDEWTHMCGKERWRGGLDTLAPVDLTSLSDTNLWQMRIRARAHLVEYARARVVAQHRQEAALSPGAEEPIIPLDPNILTLCFARRFAEYKRTDLLLQDPDRLARLLTNHQRPVQLLVAGKAHPADDIGKRALQRWQQFIQRPDVRRHVVFIEDYDITLAQHLVQGVDLWLNTPRRPWEACGTSGMKVLVNGGLNLSTLDGWWVEAYRPDLGWALGDGLEHGPEHDAADAEQLYQLLEASVVPLFYQRDKEGLAKGWVAMMRRSMAELTTRFSSNRMLQEYLEHLYLPAATRWSERKANKGELVQSLMGWYQVLHHHWHEIHLGALELQEQDEQFYRVEITVSLGGIETDMIAVEAIADDSGSHPDSRIPLLLRCPVDSAVNAYRYGAELPRNRPLADYTVRVIGAHPQALIPTENALVYWQVR